MSPCYKCKYKRVCGSPREGHECKGREPMKRTNNKEKHMKFTESAEVKK